MKRLVALFFLVSAACAYSFPPFQEAGANNDGLASSFLNSSCLNASEPDYNHPVVCAEMELLSAYPSVDYRISAGVPARILWRYAAQATSQDRETTGADGCKSYFHKTLQRSEVSANLISHFHNTSYPLYNLSSSPVDIPVPQGALDLTEGDSLTLSLEGRIVFLYRLDRTIGYMSNGSCSQIVYPSEPFNYTTSFQNNLTYLVEGGEPLHFTYKPVLGEQWAGDSQFDDLVFSKRKLYKASLFLDGAPLGSGSFYEFNITTDQFGVESIISSQLAELEGISESEIESRSTPVPLEEKNHTFPFIYEFAAPYRATGAHLLTLNFTDHFGNNFTRSFNLTSRLLTLGNSIGEDGSINISNSSLYRPSAPYVQQQMQLLVAGSGSLGVLILAVLIFRR